MTSATIEKRGAALEIRARAGRVLEGHAAVFDSPAVIGDRLTEVVKRGAFAASLASKRDVLALQDHDPTAVLGRTASGTLRLHEDHKGLAFSLDLPATQRGRDLLEMVERGDVGGMSFGFVCTDERWSGDIRELRSVRLIEISVVSAFPAYGDTTVSARSSTSGAMSAKLARAYLETLQR